MIVSSDLRDAASADPELLVVIEAEPVTLQMIEC